MNWLIEKIRGKLFWVRININRWWSIKKLLRKDRNMKKLIVLLLLVLLARIPLAEWQKIPDKVEFIVLLGQVYCQKYDCKKALIGVMQTNDEALFFVDCLEKNGKVI